MPPQRGPLSFYHGLLAPSSLSHSKLVDRSQGKTTQWTTDVYNQSGIRAHKATRSRDAHIKWISTRLSASNTPTSSATAIG